MIVSRLTGLVLLAVGLAACGIGMSPDSLGPVAPASERRELPGHVYLLRGLIGDVFSLGMDDLANKIRKRGVNASVHGVSAARFLADDIIGKYRRDSSLAPIMLIGHSTGGDEIIAMAQRLKAANIPVALAVGFDPTPIASDVPSNVELFINLYQATNLIGGGRATPGAGFRGRLVNVDLRDRKEIVHITLDKSPVIHELVTEKIVGIAELTAEQRLSFASSSNKSSSANTRMPRRAPLPDDVRPLVMKYVMPAGERIQLWDSAVSVVVSDDDTLEAIAARNGVPVWAIAQINNLGEDSSLQSGRKLLVPRTVYAPGLVRFDDGHDTAIGAARVKPSSPVR